MPIKFKTQSRKNPQDLTAPEKYYAAAVADGNVDLDRLAELISYSNARVLILVILLGVQSQILQH